MSHDVPVFQRSTVTATSGVCKPKRVLLIGCSCCILLLVASVVLLSRSDIYRIISVIVSNRIERHLQATDRSANGKICVDGPRRKKQGSFYNKCKVHVYFTGNDKGECFWECRPVDCPTPVDSTSSDESLPQTCQSRCTNRLLAQHERTGWNDSGDTGFISSGYWEARPVNSERCSSDLARDKWRHHRRKSTTSPRYCLRSFHTHFCSFAANDDVTDDSLRHCLVKRRFRSIATFGDSNGNRTFQGLFDVISKAMQSGCDLVKAEAKGAVVDTSYFFPDGGRTTENLLLGERHCHSCTSRRFRCRYCHFRHQSDDVIQLEHIAMTRALDYTIRVLPRRDGPPGANHTMEFILRDYFKDQFPDLMIITIPFVHEIRHRRSDGSDLALIRYDVETLFETVTKYTPPSTQVYWLPSHYVFGLVNDRPHDAERVKAYNAILYDVIRRRSVGKHHLFLDLYHLSCPLRRLTADHVHMMSKWYQTIAGHLLQLACTEDSTDTPTVRWTTTAASNIRNI